MMAGNPNWWSINSMHPQSHQFLYGSDNSSPSNHHQNQDFPAKSWSQFLIGGEEERFGGNLFQQQKKLENWEDQVLNLNPTFRVPIVDVKQEVAQSSNCQLYHHEDHDQFYPNKLSSNSWIHDNHNQLLQVSPPTSCITSILNFSGCKAAAAVATAEVAQGKNQHLHNQEHSSECNSTNSGGVTKKARVQQSSAQPALKVRKEKLGDRITALHQLVSPFGKTDTASVLSEAIGYIRFLQGQIEALSSPYMRNGSTVHQQHSAQERNNCLFTEDQSGQFLTHDHMGMEGRAPSKQDSQSRGGVKDLRSRGLCLVPISCTQNVANDNGADYWAPAALGGGF